MDKPRNPKNKKDNNEDFQWGKFLKGSFIWLIVIIAILFFSRNMPFATMSEEEIDYNIFLDFVKTNRISVVEIDNQTKELKGTLKTPIDITDPRTGKPKSYQEFKVYLPDVDENLAKELVEKGVKVNFVTNANDFFVILINVLPWILLLFIMFMFIRRMQGGGNGRNIFNFGKSRAKMSMEDQTKVTFKDVAGCEEAKEELKEVIDFLKFPQKFTHLGGKIPKGALLLGPPGTGKTLLAKAVAGEAGVPFFSISGADFVEMFVGVGASRVRDLFEQGRKHAPCIIFIDEIDAVGRQRGAGLGGGHDEREQTLNMLLVEMDGFDSKEGLIVVAATNRPDVLDPALLRPGRFDRMVVVDRPDVKGREEILIVHSKNIPLSKDVNLEIIAKGTPGLSGAELANLVNEAALYAARNNKQKVTMDSFELAKDKILMGVERRSMIISDDEKKRTAYHEAGHALIGKLIIGSDPVHKVTIIPRGRALGLTSFLPIDERHSYTRTYLEITLAQLLAGRVAEKLVFDELTTGAGNDLERATSLARKMVCEWGMSDKIGPVTFGKKDQEIFLGREFAQHKEHSEHVQEEIDQEIRGVVNRAEEKVTKLLTKNMKKLDKLANALLDHEILDGEEIDKILAGEKLEKVNVRKLVNKDKNDNPNTGKRKKTDEKKAVEVETVADSKADVSKTKKENPDLN